MRRSSESEIAKNYISGVPTLFLEKFLLRKNPTLPRVRTICRILEVVGSQKTAKKREENFSAFKLQMFQPEIMVEAPSIF